MKLLISLLIPTIASAAYITYEQNTCTCLSDYDCQYSPSCPNKCDVDPYYGHGVCVPETQKSGSCSCLNDYDCQYSPSCPNKCDYNFYYGRGTCVPSPPPTTPGGRAPTQPPPTNRPPTNPPPTNPPPTNRPPTNRPPTNPPPTNPPPTNRPPTNRPPTNPPPTNAPPTNAPPTNAPPTNAPPTNAPPTLVDRCLCTTRRTIPNECEVERLISLMDNAVTSFARIAPQWLRLAFHDAGTFNQGSGNQAPEGGANGCLLTDSRMRQQEENHSLDLALETLQTIKTTWEGQRNSCVTASAADIIQFAGLFAVIRQSGTPGMNASKQMQLLDTFQWGRPDESNCETSWTLNLPGFELGTQPLDDVVGRCLAAGGEIKTKMMDRNGFTAREATALLGAHTIGLTRNVFGDDLAAPWNTNGADDSTRNGPVFDNAYHSFLIFDVQATTLNEFQDNRTPLIEAFPDWHRDPVGDINHLDTDLALAFPSVDTNIHPNFQPDARSFASNNMVFMQAFMSAYDKMSKLGVTVSLSSPSFCPDCPQILDSTVQQTPPDGASLTSRNPIADAVVIAEGKLEDTAEERKDIIEFQTTPISELGF